MIGSNGVNYQMNRIMRVTLSSAGERVFDADGKVVEVVDKKGNIVEKFTGAIIEYCPLADSRLNARIDAKIEDRPVVNSKNDNPGFSAKITIYNPSPEVLKKVNVHAQWVLDYKGKTAESYNRSRCVVKVEAGYYDKDKYPKDGRGYTNIFEGKLNTSSYYRKGVDNILELLCHDIDLSGTEIQSLIKEGEGKIDTVKNVWAQTIVKALDSKKKLIGMPGHSWDEFMTLMIDQYGIKGHYSVINDSIGAMSRIIKDAGKGTTGRGTQFDMFYIKPPSNTVHPSDGMVIDRELAGWADNLDVKGVVINKAKFRDKITELCSYFPGDMRSAIDDSSYVTRPSYYFWLGGSGKTGTKSNDATRPQKIVKIYNFQNLLQVPSVDGAGCFTIKMLFNPQIVPRCGIELKWDPNYKLLNAISDPIGGVQSTTSIGNYYPSLQGGDKLFQVASLTAQTDGYLFNQVYIAGNVIHNLSTHTNNWYTETKTVALFVQVPREKK